jgi:protein kinase-like protein/WD40 repeat protein
MPDNARLATALADRYRIEREIGAGGMATVYLARDLKHDREVALKVLRPELAAVIGAERFLHEIRITARLDHPHILTLIDSGEAGGLLYYVLPFVRGESLRTRLEREKQLGITEALAINRQIAGALAYAHQHGVVHRDIKPENILIHEGEAVLTDFGIALAVKQAGGNRLTETGLSLGTPQYMSPEQATGDRELDARSDLYSLAAVLYETLAGEPPHTGATVQAVIAKLMTERPTRLRTIRDTVPEGVDAAVARALAKVPADRYAGVAEFIHALDAAASPSEHATVATDARAARRPRWIYPALAGVAVVAVAWAVLRRPTERVILPDRAQLTFSGNARTPALSADGKRLAYSTRRCDTAGRCATDVVLQDLGGAGSTTLVRGWSGVWGLQWTGDGRYLLVDGFEGAGGEWGYHAVPTLGGEPRFLSRGDGSLIGVTDTAVILQEQSGDSVAWLRWITLEDAVVHDSVAISRGGGAGIGVVVFPGGGRVFAIRTDRTGRTALMLDRRGRILDSLKLPDPGLWIRWARVSQDGRAILLPLGGPMQQAYQGPYDLLAYRVNRAGRIAARPDTILRGLVGRPTVAPDGALLVSSGPTRYEVWSLERSGSTSMRFSQRRLGSATSELQGSVSPMGDRVLLTRTVVSENGTRRQYSIQPFEGGTETTLNVPPDLLGADWNWDGSRVTLFHFSHADTISARELDPATGHISPVNALPWRTITALARLPGGGVLAQQMTPPAIRRVGAPGRPDTTIPLPPDHGSVIGLASSPDGREVAWVGWDPLGDSVLVDRVSLEDGRLTRLASFYPESGKEPFWLADGALIASIEETGATLAWYRVPTNGGPVLRLGSPPRYPAEYNMSRDGRRVIANTSEDSPDIYVIRNFARLLRR